MAKENWIERRKRYVRCKVHGLHFDPQMSSGCALCRKEGRLTTPPQRPQFLILLLSLLGMAGMAFYLFGPYAEAVTDRPLTGTPPDLTPEKNAVRLDSDLYRDEIVRLETSLLRSADSDLSNLFDSIGSGLEDLAAAIREREPAERQMAAADLDVVAGPFNAATPELEALRDARDGWLRIRRERFTRESWFGVVANAETDRAVLATYQQAAQDLVGLILEAQLEAEALAEPSTPSYGTDLDRAAERDRKERWQSYLGDLQQRLEQLRSDLPARPDAGAPAQLLMATQKLEQAIERTRSMTRGTTATSASRSLDPLVQMAEDARQAFDELLL